LAGKNEVAFRLVVKQTIGMLDELSSRFELVIPLKRPQNQHGILKTSAFDL